jgi:hypothetical protein
MSYQKNSTAQSIGNDVKSCLMFAAEVHQYLLKTPEETSKKPFALASLALMRLALLQQGCFSGCIICFAC